MTVPVLKRQYITDARGTSISRSKADRLDEGYGMICISTTTINAQEKYGNSNCTSEHRLHQILGYAR